MDAADVFCDTIGFTREQTQRVCAAVRALARLTPLEALRGMPVHAAKALVLKVRGQLGAAQRAYFAVWQVAHPRELATWFGRNPCSARVVAGKEHPV